MLILQIIHTKIKNGEIFKKVNPDDTDHMHGIATTSLLASVAKDSEIHFFSGTIEDYVQYIINHNENCKEEDKILVASGSWRDKDFENHRDALSKVGCELVCTNNFDKNFNEFTSDIEGRPTGCPIDFSEEEISELIQVATDSRIKELIEKRVEERLRKLENEGKIEPQIDDEIKAQIKEKIKAEVESEIDSETKEGIKTQVEGMVRAQATKRDNVKIPISRTYYQVGENGIVSKYQSIYSTSWGVPQVAGLLAVFKEQYKDLTFEQFCDLARESAKDNEMKIIDVQRMYDLINERGLKQVQQQSNHPTQSPDETTKKDGITDVFYDGQVKISSVIKAKQCIESERTGATIENTQKNDDERKSL